MSLRHALLALLEAGPMTGYELAKQFDASLRNLWCALPSQIYPELRDMESEGLISAEPRARGPRAVKRAYLLTAKGAQELVDWIRRDDAPRPVRDPAYLKAMYLEYESFDEARKFLRYQLDHYRGAEEQWMQHIALLQRHDTELLRRRLAQSPEDAHEAVVAFKMHAYDGLVERARAGIAWAERGLVLVDRLERAGGVPRERPVLCPTVLRNDPSARPCVQRGTA